MKKIIVLLFAVLSLAACREEQPDGSQYAIPPELEVDSRTAEFPAAGGTVQITVTSNTSVIVGSEKAWVTANAIGTVVSITAEENTSLESRYAIVTLVSGELATTVQVIQFGKKSNEE